MRPKNVVRTVRMSEDLDAILEKDAKAKGISVSALVTSILTKYKEWDRFAEPYGFVHVDMQTFRSILNATIEEKLVAAGTEAGSRGTKEMLNFWFGKYDLEALNEFGSLVSRYGCLYRREHGSEAENVIVLHHDLGERWSTFLAETIREAYRNMAGVTPNIDITRFGITFKASPTRRPAAPDEPNADFR